jgi:hypothetical protein
MEFVKGGGQLRRAEVRPHPVGEPQLGVRALPQQKVREPLLAAGANEQVDVGEQRTRTDRGARRVVDGNPQLEARPVRRPLLGGGDGADELTRAAGRGGR